MAAWNSCRSAPAAPPVAKPAPPACGADPRTERMATVRTCIPSCGSQDDQEITESEGEPVREREKKEELLFVHRCLCIANKQAQIS